MGPSTQARREAGGQCVSERRKQEAGGKGDAGGSGEWRGGDAGSGGAGCFCLWLPHSVPVSPPPPPLSPLLTSLCLSLSAPALLCVSLPFSLSPFGLCFALSLSPSPSGFQSASFSFCLSVPSVLSPLWGLHRTVGPGQGGEKA
ncbi:hypothetical protein HJG60_011031 [Phyllostomus discolor]|uniref:Uncharacterized protein n=1 Tax=Phyllostomus discolor TaxID=89673 RepID=A0A834E6P9_9CHIR|nr:hypothetical protein HJG60_011031 [Phyllostomus discolor]